MPGGRRLLRSRRAGHRRGAAVPAAAGKGRGAIKADRSAQLRLLDLQAVDSTLAQLEYRRRTLPERVELQQLQGARTATAAEVVAAETAVSDLERDQGRAEADLEPVRERLVRNQKRIADGSVADPKALSSMVDEVEHLRRRIGDLEDIELEIMEQLETAAATRATAAAKLAELDARGADLVARRDRALVLLDMEVAEQRRERERLVPLLPADLVALYTKIGASRGGVGAAELKARRCTGCQLEINASDLGRFAAAPEDEVLRCEECSRILIRTSASGL